jgi:hypothetical protein
MANMGTSPDPEIIFVFGSNLLGIHGRGSARTALDEWAAGMYQNKATSTSSPLGREVE